jgi:hypothetical protein
MDQLLGEQKGLHSFRSDSLIRRVILCDPGKFFTQEVAALSIQASGNMYEVIGNIEALLKMAEDLNDSVSRFKVMVEDNKEV